MHIFEEWVSHCLETGESKSSADEINGDARKYFERLCSSWSNEKNGASIKNSISTNLALLISKMDAPLSSKLNYHKLNALKCLRGALDAIDNSIGFPMKMIELMSKFFLEYCGPMQPVEIIVENSTIEEDCSIDEIRDEALHCLKSLLHGRYFTEDDTTDKNISIQLRISIMKEGIQKRCASDEYDNDEAEYYYEHNISSQNEQAKILSNLSLLPRTKRSLCFSVLEATIRGLSIDIGYPYDQNKSPLVVKTFDYLFSFVEFSCSCLHGESDPRCLLQMLNLLKQVQSVILPCCIVGIEKEAARFPFMAIFDAVTPYYPIKFTPPPNDPWGITKEGLQGSLLDVLTYSTHHIDDKTVQTGSNVKGDNMTAMVSNLFLRRLHIEKSFYDEEDEDIITTQDRIDALQELFELLFPTCYYNQSSPQQKFKSSITDKQLHFSLLSLSHEQIREMSDTIRCCHEHAALSVVSSTNMEDKKKYIRLADLSRNFANRISYELEIIVPIQKQLRIDLKKPLWDSFVLRSVKELTDVIASAPQSMKGRVSIAFIASLSACGGEKTLRLCLETYMPLLVRLLSLNDDEEKISTAANGISAFFSSTMVSIEHIISKDLIVIHPHPLQKFASEVIDLLCKISVKEEASDQLKGAAMKALESVLVSCPNDIITLENTELVKNTILHIVQSMINYISKVSTRVKPSEDWKSACSRILGTTIGRSIANEDILTKSCSILLENNNYLSSFVMDTILPKILAISAQNSDSTDDIRLDWKVLAYACETGGKGVSELIVSHMFETLTLIIQSKSQNERIQSATLGLAYVLQHGGMDPTLAFHHLGLQVKLIDTLSKPPDYHQEIGMSNLVLPEVREKTQAEVEKVVKLSFQILPHLLAAYHDYTPNVHAARITASAAEMLPPLSDNDNIRLSCVLPILSTILAGRKCLDESTLSPLLLPLVDYTLAKDNHEASKSAASSCIFSIISKYLNEKNLGTVKQILCDVLPIILMQLKPQYYEQDFDVPSLGDALNLLALIGASSACRGGLFSAISNDVATLLVTMACQDFFPVTGLFASIKSKETIDLRQMPNVKKVTLSVLAGNSFGSMLSVQNGNPFWRQRISQQVILPHLLSSEFSQLNLEQGRLICACHLVCCVPFRALGEKRFLKLSSMIVNGLEACIKLSNKNSFNQKVDHEIKEMLIASLMKVLDQYPQSIVLQAPQIIPLMILTLISADDIHEVPTQLIALQILINIVEAISTSDNGVASIYPSYKETLITHLAELNDHPSVQIRQAVAVTRNYWFVFNN